MTSEMIIVGVVFVAVVAGLYMWHRKGKSPSGNGTGGGGTSPGPRNPTDR